MINTNKLKGRMAELGLTQSDIAQELQLSKSTVCQKINGSRPMNLDEAETIAAVLKIANEELGEYFFAQKIA